MGRPSKRTPEIERKIIEGLSKGWPLTVICQPDDMPCDDTVRNWGDADEDFSRDIARARKTGFDQIAWDALTIADTPIEGVIEKTGKDGLEITRADMLGHRKLQVDTRLKLLAKWDPKRYGDRIAQEISGPDGSPVGVALSPVTLDEVADRIAKARERRE